MIVTLVTCIDLIRTKSPEKYREYEYLWKVENMGYFFKSKIKEPANLYLKTIELVY